MSPAFAQASSPARMSLRISSGPGLGDRARHERHRVVDEDARGRAVLEALDAPAGRVTRPLRDAGRPQRGGVGPDRVAVHPPENDGRLRRGGPEGGRRRERRVGPAVLVPVAPTNPLARGGRRGAALHARENLLFGKAADVERAPERSESAHMAVRVGEAGHDDRPREVDDAGLGRERARFALVADEPHAAALDENRGHRGAGVPCAVYGRPGVEHGRRGRPRAPRRHDQEDEKREEGCPHRETTTTPPFMTNVTRSSYVNVGERIAVHRHNVGEPARLPPSRRGPTSPGGRLRSPLPSESPALALGQTRTIFANCLPFHPCG